jgi:hypothetical protein
MSSNLPSESCLDKTVETFGLGTYDHPQWGFEHGEDSNKKHTKESLPQDGGPLDPFGPDRLLSYPTNLATSMVPGDYDRPPMFKTPVPSHLDSVVHSVSSSELPSGLDGPVARSDYYDKMTTAESIKPAIEDMFAGADTGAYVAGKKSRSKKAPVSGPPVLEEVGHATMSEMQSNYDISVPTEYSKKSLPSIPDNYESRDNFLNSLGNYWSGYTVEDQNVPQGFPSTEFLDDSRWQKTNASTGNMKKVAVNLDLVKTLTSGVMKEFGKKDLSRRHIMSFLKKKNEPQYLASDIVRCLGEVHGIHVMDNLDVFPVLRTASTTVNLTNTRNKIISLEVDNLIRPEVSAQLRYAAAELSNVLALLERMGDQNGSK